MVREYDTTNIPYSLPCNTHSLAIATRTPSAGYTQHSEYTPDYGGLVEIPGHRLKNNGLTTGLPFLPNPYYVRVIETNELEWSSKPKCPDCLAVASYLESSEAGQNFTTIRALGSTLSLDLLRKVPVDPEPPEIFEFESYAHVPYSYEIKGIKYKTNLNDSLLIKFDQGIKILELNKMFQIPSLTDSSLQISNQAAIKFIESIPANEDHLIDDACISNHNKSMVCIASSNRQNLQVRIYDIKNTKRLVTTTSLNLRDGGLRDDRNAEILPPRRNSLRSFIPTKRSIELVQQLESDPSHLFNMLITTSDRVCLIDPRNKDLSRTYLDMNHLETRLPTESIRLIEFSTKNEYQLYALTNVNLIAFDIRYPLKPMNAVSHMMNSSDPNSMFMRLTIPQGDAETLCLSSAGRLAFLTFDRSSNEQLVNPMSLHQPIQEPSPMEITGKMSDELSGLTVTSEAIFERGVLFSVLQLSQEGDVCIRGYQPNGSGGEIFIPKSKKYIIGSEKQRGFKLTNQNENLDMIDRDALESSSDESDADTVILDLSFSQHIDEIGQNLTSKRAVEKFDNMKDKLGCK